MSDAEPKRRRGKFDDALKGYYQDHDSVLPDENTDYKSLNAESVGSLILGLLSVLTFVSMLFIIFPIMGIALGITAIRKILRASQELAGLEIASAGVGLSIALSVSAMVYHVYMARFEVPAGYMALTFEDILADSRTGRIPDPILRLSPHRDEHGNVHSGTPVFIEGFMFPTRQMTEIRSFMLVPSVEQGQFGSITRNPTQMIEVTFSGDRRVPYRSTSVKVGGILTINPDAEPGKTPYSLRADVFR
ncbi:MAG: hypothetical protein FWG73_06405 [Planctomycetaceae bacterium]|nr:hypothetical protein [Planctomycetaceae bacterium]